jgi:formylglycine-generating enzyme required for sulfatase activity
VISSPAGAQVWINDQLQEDRTPATFSLVPGTYTIQVHEKGYVMADASVTIGPNEEKSIRLEMMEGDAPEGMVLVPAGEFIMGFDQGAPDERPQRKVFLDAFYIDRYEVTNEEYQRVVPTHTFPKGKERFPVTGVSWEQARAYAEAVGKRLPREAEWEKAARGTDGREYPWGMRFDANLCNTADKKNLGPEEVGSYRAGASPYGCMDMAGNVQEWTADWYNAYEGNTDIQKDYGQVFRVLRGGSYLTDQYTARCARRQYDRSQSAKEDYGFRCAKDVEKGPDRTRNASLR